MSPPQLWLLAGGNGAGKTTFYRNSPALSGLPFVNADRIARRLRPDAPEPVNVEAAVEADRLRTRYIESGVSFCAETVFSHPSKVQLVERAKANGYEVNLVYVHLADELYAARVLQRVSEGGHDVPAEKILVRVFRLRERVREALPMCDSAWLYDNSDSDRPFELVLSVEASRISAHVTPTPSWASHLTSGIDAN